MNFSKRPIQGIVIPVAVAVFLASFFTYLPPLVEDVINNANVPIDDVYSQHTQSLATQFEVADLHCDALFWATRNLLQTKKHPLYPDRTIGAVDLPRLIAGNVRIQVFAVSASSRSIASLNIPGDCVPVRIGI